MKITSYMSIIVGIILLSLSLSFIERTTLILSILIAGGLFIFAQLISAKENNYFIITSFAFFLIFLVYFVNYILIRNKFNLIFAIISLIFMLINLNNIKSVKITHKKLKNEKSELKDTKNKSKIENIQKSEVKNQKSEQSKSNNFKNKNLKNPEIIKMNYVASKTGKRYHIEGCDIAKRINKNSMLFFKDKKEASKKGFKACDICLK